MGLGDVLFGRKKLAGPNLEKLFALSSAQVTLEAELGLRPAGVAAIVFKPLSAGEFERVGAEVRELLDVVAKDCGAAIERSSDSFGFEWIVVRDPDFEDLVTAVHLVASELEARGFGAQLLAALFRFDGRDQQTNLVYGFKRGTFWPFVPTGEGQRRDTAAELRLKSELDGELPIEPDLERWLGLFDAPVR